MFIEVGVLLLAAMLLETRVCVSAVQESLLKDNFILIEHMGVSVRPKRS
jgi:UDP-N-acetylglucosamine enolpyruvyl transferase